MNDFPSFLSALRPEVDEALDRLLPGAETEPAEIHEAMRYSVFAGGKRVRPALVVLAGEAWGGAREDLLVGGAALEMVHTFSLIHDDLPALDDDDLRRGRPTLHRARGEAMAVLAGDALLNRAYEVLSREPASAPPERRLQAVRLVADAVGTAGMIGGQVFDLQHEGGVRGSDAESLERIHRLKTGALIEASTRLGGVYAGAGSEGIEQAGRIGAELGLLFQIGDDILDEVGSSEELGKTPGKDRQAGKLTYPGLFGLEGSRKKALQAADRCLGLIEGLPSGRELFRALVAFLVHRGS
ncbi:MAG: polyprenyl synthetase family protein [Holophagales bacterium]|nr:polyprenyl synthetase family protein [Holophagales bacterium]MYD20795.1 polyprenyl synthetase family protein [Holophagales bacterium]MYI33688.1 polyprenyl synthetase family protein [Holophagales bacterium]